MHIIVAFLGLVGGGLFWCYRLRAMGEAAHEIVDHAGRARGYFRRKKIRKQTELSPLTAIEDPAIAAATVIYAIISEDNLPGDNQIEAVRSVIANISDAKKAEWAYRQIGNTATVIEKTSPLLRGQLNDMEKHELIDMVNKAAAAVSVSPHYSQRVKSSSKGSGLK
jgi:uncharacterized tellurite resistance protein B-like protein